MCSLVESVIKHPRFEGSEALISTSHTTSAEQNANMAQQGSSLPTPTSTATSPAEAVLHDSSTPSRPPPPPSSSTNDAAGELLLVPFPCTNMDCPRQSCSPCFRTHTVDNDGTTSATTAEAPDPATNDGSTSSAPAPPPPPVPSSANDATSELLDCGSFHCHRLMLSSSPHISHSHFHPRRHHQHNK